MTFTGLNEVGQIGLTVTDLARATEFYRDKLGMTELFQTETMAFYDLGQVRLLLSLPEEASQVGGAIVYFRSRDIDADTNVLQQRGVKILGQPHLIAPMADHDLWMSFFADSEGNTLALMQEKAKAD